MQKNKTEILIQKYLSHQLNEQEFEEFLNSATLL